MPKVTQKQTGLSGNQLKIIALIAMTCDHVGMQLLPQFGFLRIIGRLAMPIFAYMIAEGCRYTRSCRKYLCRMLLLALACQVVYFVALGSLYQCILVTFSLSAGLIFSLDNTRTRRDTASELLALGVLIGTCFFCVGLPVMLSGTDFAVDYGICGVALPVLVFFGKSKRDKLLLTTVGIILLGLDCGGAQWWALCAVPLLALYSGKRGKLPIGNLFYIYYPLHLVVIYGIGLLL